MSITAKVEHITPAQAEIMLATSANTGRKNRVLSHATVLGYARQMLDGNWKVNGEGLSLGTDGWIINGQHRLNGCAKAGVPFDTLVTRGLDSDVFDTIDGGYKRTAANILYIDGVANSNLLASAVRWFLALSNDDGSKDSRRQRIANHEIRIFLQEHPDMQRSSVYGNRVSKMMPGGLACALHYIFAKKDRNVANKFFEDLAAGVELTATDPVKHLRERLFKVRGQQKQTTPGTEIAAMVINAWNRRRDNKTLQYLKGTVRSPKTGQVAFPAVK